MQTNCELLSMEAVEELRHNQGIYLVDVKRALMYQGTILNVRISAAHAHNNLLIFLNSKYEATQLFENQSMHEKYFDDKAKFDIRNVKDDENIRKEQHSLTVLFIHLVKKCTY